MRFVRLRLEGYRRFRQPFECQFGEGLNLICGPNESGKSTLLNALLDALYANPFSMARELSERVAFGHPGGWQLWLELERDECRLCLYKRYAPDDPARRSEFRVVSSPHPFSPSPSAVGERVLQSFSPTRGGESAGEGAIEGKAALQRWEQLWGVPREVYLATACIRQHELSAIATDKKSLRSLQQQLRENALMTDLERILKLLQDEIRSVDRQLESLHQQRAERTTALQQAEQAAQQIREHRQRLQALTEQIAQSQQLIEQEQALLERWQAIQHCERVRTDAEQLRRVLDTLERIDSELQRLQNRLQQEYGSFLALPDNFYEQHILPLIQQYERTAREEQQAEAQLQQLRPHIERLIARQRARTGLGVAGVALVLTGVSLVPVNGLIGGMLIGLGCLTLLLMLLWRPANARELDSQRRQLEQRLEDARQQRQSAQRRLLAMLPQEDRFEPDTSGAVDHLIERFRERYQQYRRLCSERENLQSQREGLLQAHDPDQLRQRWSQLAIELHARESELSRDPLTEQLADRPPEEWLQRQRHLQALLAEQEQAIQEKLRLEGALNQLQLEHDPAELRLQRWRLEEQITALERRLERLRLTRELLLEANRRYLSDLSPLLKPRIEIYLPALTCGRYTQVQMGDGLLFQVYHPQAGDWLDADPHESGWSAGTLDQIFFACRLGLCDALAGDRRLPLLLDDPFLAFDSERLQAAMELLTRITQHTQVLLFTCRLPDSLPPDVNLIELPAPADHQSRAQ